MHTPESFGLISHVFEGIGEHCCFCVCGLLHKISGQGVQGCMRVTHIQDKWHCNGSCVSRSRRQLVLLSELRPPSKQSKMLYPKPISLEDANHYDPAYENARVIATPTKPLTDATLMIQPRSPLGCGCCFNICIIAYLEPRKTERALTAITWFHSSSRVSWIMEGGGAMPALLTILQGLCKCCKEIKTTLWQRGIHI